MPVMTNTNPAPDDPIAKLWQIARALVSAAIHAFGAPDEVARTLSRFARHALARRLRALETLAMKLLLVEAARVPPVPPASSRHANAKTIAARRTDIAGCKPVARPADPARPETWRVRFELRIPRAHERAAQPRRPSARMAALRACAPDMARERAKAEKLARRLEALRRVVADPLPRARRLRRKLLALKAHAYDTGLRIAFRRPPHNELNPILHERAEFAACAAIHTLVPAPDSS
jgi:hypothetical protein